MCQSGANHTGALRLLASLSSGLFSMQSIARILRGPGERNARYLSISPIWPNGWKSDLRVFYHFGWGFAKCMAVFESSYSRTSWQSVCLVAIHRHLCAGWRGGADCGHFVANCAVADRSHGSDEIPGVYLPLVCQKLAKGQSLQRGTLCCSNFARFEMLEMTKI